MEVSTSNTPRLNVSIVTYRVDLDELARCLRSLDSGAVAAIYIIDNAGEERVRQFVAQWPKTVYLSADNPGYGAAHNIAMRRSLTDRVPYHLVLNSDVEFDPAILPRLIAEMDRRPDVGQLQPRVTYGDGRLQYTVRMLPTPVDVFVRRFLPKGWFKRRRDAYLLKHLDHNSPFNVPYHQGSFMLLRCEALREVGLFDERFFMYPEDIDLTRRIHERYVTLYYPAETIIHRHRAESYTNWRLLRIHIVNMARYFSKWGWWCDPGRRKANRSLRP